MKESERKTTTGQWFPYQANLSGKIFNAPCRYYEQDHWLWDADTDDTTLPEKEDLKMNGAINEFSKEIIIAIALEAERLGIPYKQHSLVLANVEKYIYRHQPTELKRYFVIDGEKIEVDNRQTNRWGNWRRSSKTELEKRYLDYPEGLNTKESKIVCRVCPYKPDVFGEIVKKNSVVLKPERESSKTEWYNPYKYCTSTIGKERTIHGECKLPNQYYLG